MITASSFAALLLSYVGPKLLVKYGSGIALSLLQRLAVSAIANAQRPLTPSEKQAVERDRAQTRADIGSPME